MRHEHAAIDAFNELRLKLNPSIPIQYEGFARQEGVLMRLQDAGLIAEVIHPARNRHDDLLPLLTRGGADHEQMEPIWVLARAGRDEDCPLFGSRERHFVLRQRRK
jgi:hypothetical protein